MQKLICVYEGFEIYEIFHYGGIHSHYNGVGITEQTKHYTPCAETLEETKEQISRFWQITYTSKKLFYFQKAKRSKK